MNKKILSSLVLMFASASVLSACNGLKQVEDFEIELADSIVSAYVDEEYDFSDCFVHEEGIDYSIRAYYQDFYEKKEYELPVDGFTFTPTEVFDVSVVIEAKKDTLIKHKTAIVDVLQKGDPIDELIATGGFSGWADTGWRKELTKSPQYIKVENTKTALSVSYRGNNVYRWGASLLCMNNFRCLDYWTDKTWENAIITYWVYNPTDYDLRFQLRVVDNYTKTSTSCIDYDWSDDHIEQVAEGGGKWTQCFFPLIKYGINHTLFINEDNTRNDSLIVKVRWDGAPKASVTPLYSLQFFVDGLDVVPAETYPEVDTNVPDKIEGIVMNSWVDSGMTKSENYDKDYIVDGKSSIKYNYSGKAYNYGCATVTINNASLLDLWTVDSWENAIVVFKVFNCSSKNILFQPRIKSVSQEVDVDWSNSVTSQVAEPNVWSTILFSLRKVGITKPLWYGNVAGEQHVDELLIKSAYDSSDANWSYEMYVDSIDIVPASQYPDVDTTAPVKPEKVSEGMENIAVDDGWQSAITSFDDKVVYTADNPNSRTSLKATFAGRNLSNKPSVVLSTEHAGLPTIDMRSGTLQADIHFENVSDTKVMLKIVQEGWSIDKSCDNIATTPLSDGWYRFSLDLGGVADFAVISKCIRICFYFKGLSDANKENAVIHLDNVMLVK